MVKCRETPLEGEGHVKPRETLYVGWSYISVESMWVNIRCMLIAPAKISECERSISPSSFYGQLSDY